MKFCIEDGIIKFDDEEHFAEFCKMIKVVPMSAIENIKSKITNLDEGITSYHNDRPWVYKDEVLAIIDRHIGKENHEDCD